MRIHSEVAGEGPGIVLLHEGICDSRMWDTQWETFTRSHRVLRLDFRGYGRSPIEPGPYSSARDVIETMDRHGFERAALVGEEDVPDIQSIAERLAREIPGSRRATIANTAHVPSMERPREFEELVLGFIDEAA